MGILQLVDRAEQGESLSYRLHPNILQCIVVKQYQYLAIDTIFFGLREGCA